MFDHWEIPSSWHYYGRELLSNAKAADYRTWKDLAGGYLALCWGWIVIGGMIAYFALPPEQFRNLTLTWTVKVTFIALVVWFGWVLHKLKKRNAMTYGLLEIGTGILVNWFNLDKAAAATQGSAERLAIFIGGIYLIKRGIDTVADANEKSTSSRLKASTPSAG